MCFQNACLRAAFTYRTKKYRRHMKAQFQGSADRTHFSAAVCIDASGKRYQTHFCTMGGIDVILPPGSGELMIYFSYLSKLWVKPKEH